ncbi:hypothetical protein CCO03_14515 [Comamonas serinivorans]|uniref:Uncharacterized protein n=1 Tax=Comamonas serinivorans TaxID=1082851 RepID=A0A1Y0EQ85_9BURK|nr:hypothetical protein [Comamonas serinivorans]ARU05736.1 hypothetical protein CCO03_14515 [Comamonas serinivorans]
MTWLAAAAMAWVCSAGPSQAQLFGPGTGTTATQLRWTSDEPGHQLITPYFSTQGDNNTLLSWVNTDPVNGKLLKVRFRGAANGDTLLDFMVLLGPSDVWTASLSQGEDGLTRLVTPDNSCTLPASLSGVAFRTDRLQPELPADAKALHTREGLVEAIVMADVAPGDSGVLFNVIRPQKGLPASCDAAALAVLTQPAAITREDQARAVGLAPPTGGLMGMWQIIRLSNYASYSGRQHAVAAVDAQGRPAVANWAFAPQTDVAAGSAGLAQTTDPVLTLNGLSWSDLPDLSTPLAGTSAQAQVEAQHSRGEGRPGLANEFVHTVEATSVPGATDWVISQPLRRYVVAVDPRSGQLLRLPGVSGVVLPPNGEMGSMVCSPAGLEVWNREMNALSDAGFALPQPWRACGVVTVVTFGSVQVLQAGLTPLGRELGRPGVYEAGWAIFRSRALSQDGLRHGPMLGYSATSLRNTAQNGNYGSVVPHVRVLN